MIGFDEFEEANDIPFFDYRFESNLLRDHHLWDAALSAALVVLSCLRLLFLKPLHHNGKAANGLH